VLFAAGPLLEMLERLTGCRGQAIDAVLADDLLTASAATHIQACKVQICAAVFDTAYSSGSYGGWGSRTRIRFRVLLRPALD